MKSSLHVLTGNNIIRVRGSFRVKTRCIKWVGGKWARGCIIILSNNGYEKDRKILDPKTDWKGLVRRGVPRRLRWPTVRAQDHLQASAQREGDPQSVGVDAVADCD